MIIIQEDQITPYLNSLAGRLKNTTPLMGELSEQLHGAIQENFLTEGRSLLGVKWQELKPATIKSKQRRKRPLSILQDSSRLFSTISSSYGADYAEAGSNMQYAAIHQFGGTIQQGARSEMFERLRNKRGRFKKLKSREKRPFKRGFTFGSRTITIPARPFLGVGEKTRGMMTDTINDYVLRGE